MKNIALHWQIIIGMVAGVLFGIVAIQFEGGKELVVDWVQPFGTIFINLLKLIAVPLIITSLLMGISGMKDISQFSRMGGRTLIAYVFTTAIAITIGLILVNIIKPGSFISPETTAEMTATFSGETSTTIDFAKREVENGPLKPLIDLVPENIFMAASDNGNMLQVIFFVIFFGIGLILIPPKTAEPIKKFFNGLNEVVMKMIDIIMLGAPYGVFALMAALIANSPNIEIFTALGVYALTVLLGLGILIFVVYPLIIRIFTKGKLKGFLKKIAPAQLVAFSTSSSAATLPVTMERVNEHIGVDEEVTSFVLPLGATINMDGTALYQGVAAVFIAQVFGYDLSLVSQLSILLTATLASIGAAAVPSAGILMLVIVLESIGVDPAGIALIFAIDRPLDMCRTVVNITSDSTIAVVIAESLDKLGEPNIKDWDDHYKQE